MYCWYDTQTVRSRRVMGVVALSLSAALACGTTRPAVDVPSNKQAAEVVTAQVESKPAAMPTSAELARPAVTEEEPQFGRAQALSGELSPRVRELSAELPGRTESSFGRGAVVGTSGQRGQAATGSGYGAASGGFHGRDAKVHAASVSPYQANTERYAHAHDNAFQTTKDTPLSTFAIDVDTASYANVRRFLHDGVLPPPDAVRIEELVNYFSYDYPQPSGDEPVSVTTEVANAPWQPDHRLLRIGLRTRALDNERAPTSNLVFLIDVSGSMASNDKLPLLKRGLAMLAQNLRAQDRVAIVVYAGASGLALPSTPGSQRADVLAALERLDAGGSTNGADGIRLAYEVARQNFVKGGVNRVVLATDGDFNVGTTSEGELVRLIETERKTGVFLTVLGFGRDNLNDSGMEALADHGNGSYAYIDSLAEAHKVLVREAGGTLVTVAKDVKLQLEWNPTRVASYRLIGFENRLLAARDFNDDKKDAGELGAGHDMTALYEIVPLTAAGAAPREVDPLRYQTQAITEAAGSDELVTIKLRYKRPDSDVSQLLSRAVHDAAVSGEASRDLRWAAAVAGFGMLLRNSEHKGQASLAQVDALARNALGSDPEGQRHEFVSLIEQARMLGVQSTGPSARRSRVARP
ncbi:MAG: hypothetical protein RL701_3045 [Pseudomonadota bacterium]